MVHIEELAYTRSEGSGGESFLVAYGSAMPTMNPEDLKAKNTCYFAARDHRNALRQEALGSPAKLIECADALTNLDAARECVTHALSIFNRVTEFDTPLSPDSTTLERLVFPEGIRKWDPSNQPIGRAR